MAANIARSKLESGPANETHITAEGDRLLKVYMDQWEQDVPIQIRQKGASMYPSGQDAQLDLEVRRPLAHWEYHLRRRLPSMREQTRGLRMR